ncbi:peritrophin-44-like isoform X2 [Cylas formicarius]|uniref:peritrophin-44-like isoform X2 n=2 Tax=Cylas formicarius TaxID=197179 RepID=UPI002958D7C3|nr:peritrophin-44-like isoform X2 [Cylas formicarius]XP_060524849.1 peritrophin-44-like isoform X2 [Cylas formicarius]
MSSIATSTSKPNSEPTKPSFPSSSSKEPVFTIEPPEILYGSQYLNKKCLKPRGQFPSYSCNKFVNCWDGIASEQTCPTDLVFNPVKGYCDYLSNTDCGKKSIENSPEQSNVLPPTTVTQAPIVTSTNSDLKRFCRTARGLFPGRTCDKYVSCWDDNVIEGQCPDGTLFSSKGYCDFAQNVECISYDADSVGQATLSANNTEIKDNKTAINVSNSELQKLCKQSKGLFRGTSCNRYVNCWDGNVVEGQCPEGTLFSTKGYCDFAHNVDCESHDKTKLEQHCPSEFGTFRSKSNCSNYYICAYHKIVARYECPEGFHFSDILGVCDYASRVDCSQNSNVNKKIGIANENCPITNGAYRDSQNCASYYVCSLGKIVANYLCPPGFNFNNDRGTCDYAERVNCNQGSIMVNIGTSSILPEIPQEIMNKVRSCTPGSIFPLNSHCTSACICRSGLAEIVQCSAGLAYDSKLNKCVPIQLAGC